MIFKITIVKSFFHSTLKAFSIKIWTVIIIIISMFWFIVKNRFIVILRELSSDYLVDPADYQNNFNVSTKSTHVEIKYSIFTTFLNITNVLTSVFADIK